MSLEDQTEAHQKRLDQYGGDETLAALVAMHETEYEDMSDEQLAERAKGFSGLDDVVRTTSSPELLDRIVRNPHLDIGWVEAATQNGSAGRDTLHAAAERVTEHLKGEPINPNMIGQDSKANRTYWNLVTAHEHGNLDERTVGVVDGLGETLDQRGEENQRLTQEMLDREGKERASREWVEALGHTPTDQDYENLYETTMNGVDSQVKEARGTSLTAEERAQLTRDVRKGLDDLKAHMPNT